MRNRLMNKDRGSSPSSSSSSSSPHSSQLPHHPTHTRKPKLALLREVFGRGCYTICHKHAESNATIVSCQSFMSNSFVVSFRFSLLLAASSPLQPPIGWWHLLLCPSWLWRLTLVCGQKKRTSPAFVCEWQKKLVFFCPSLMSYPSTWALKRKGGEKWGRMWALKKLTNDYFLIASGLSQHPG